MWLTIKFGNPDTGVIDSSVCDTKVLALRVACAKLAAGFRIYEIRWANDALFMNEQQITEYCKKPV
jgi:hypothetical protein